MPETLPEPTEKPEKAPAQVKKSSSPAAPGRAAAARVPEEPEPQLSDNRSGQEEGICFINAEHHRFYSKTLQRFSDPATPEKALCYCLGIHPAIREHVEYIYDFSTGQVTPECMQEEWVTSTEDPEDIRTVIRMAYNLYGGTPSVTEWENARSIPQRSCSVAVMHRIFGKLLRFVIQNTQNREGKNYG